MLFTITIGTLTGRYTILETTAPERYDHGSVIPIATYGPYPTLGDNAVHRLVAVPEGTVEWQMGRNASGLYPTALFDPASEDSKFLGVDAGVISGRLFERLMVPNKEKE